MRAARVEPLAVALIAAFLCGACSRSQEPPRLLAGVFAVEGTVRIESALDPGFQRTARAGMGLFSDQILTVEEGSRLILESQGTRFVALERGRHRLASLRALNAAPKDLRLVQRVDARDVEARQAGPLIVPVRYEPLRSAPAPKSPLGDMLEDSGMREGMAFFFLPASMQPPSPEPDVPPWKAREHRVRPLGRPLKATSDGRRLVRAKGLTAIEFRDHATSFADRLTLPLDLGDVERIVAVNGEMTLELPSGERRFKAGSEVVIAHAEGATDGPP